jgi:predicted flap endonuclease-1-like 5' DNA nuclease
MNLQLIRLKGMTEDSATKLKGHGISHSAHLLKAARTTKDREALAAKTGMTAEQVLELANRADLARIKGVGSVYSNLLEEAGVDTVKELAHRVPANLHAKLIEVNKEKKLTRNAPALEQVKAWVAQAKKLAPAIQY